MGRLSNGSMNRDCGSQSGLKPRSLFASDPSPNRSCQTADCEIDGGVVAEVAAGAAGAAPGATAGAAPGVAELVGRSLDPEPKMVELIN